MAIARTLDPTMREEWDAWVASRPEPVRAMIRSHPPDRLYRDDCGQRVLILAYSEDGTVCVLVSGEYNLVAFEREVFGVPIGGLVECDLPGPGEPTGCLAGPATGGEV